VTQATQNYPAHDVPLVQSRSAWVRVFVVANQVNTATPQVRVRFINGSTTNTFDDQRAGWLGPFERGHGERDEFVEWPQCLPRGPRQERK